MADYYVTTPGSGGSDSADGSIGTPWATLGKAAATVPDGANHTIHVAAGTYAGMTDDRSGASPGYRYWLADGAVILTSLVTINGAWVKFDGFTITGALTVGFQTSDTTANCVFTNLTMSGPRYGANINGTNNLISYWDMSLIEEDYFHVYGSGHTFSHNYIHDHLHPVSAYHSDVWQTYDAGAGALVAQNITIEYNHVFLGNDSTGALTGEGTGSIHVFMWEDVVGRHASGLTVRNNIFESIGGLNAALGHLDGLRVYNNLWRNDDDISRTSSSPGVSIANADDVEIKNNLFIDGTQGVNFTSVTNAVNASNLFWRNDTGSTTNTNYSSTGDVVNQNPLFAAYNNDVYNLTDAYKLQSASPAKDAGTTVATVTDDFDGVSRPRGAAYDIGPYEYGDPAALFVAVTL